MDLTIPIKNIKLNIRTGILLNTPEGFIFERDKRNSALFPIGGRVKTEEDSKSAIIREVKEETGLILESVKFHSIIENFFTHEGIKFHEILFMYVTEINYVPKLTENYFFIKADDIQNHNVQPKILNKTFFYPTEKLYINRDNEY